MAYFFSDPWDEMARMQRRMDSMLNHFWGQPLAIGDAGDAAQTQAQAQGQQQQQQQGALTTQGDQSAAAAAAQGGPLSVFAPAARFWPRVDVSENDKEVTVHAELPGMAKQDIQVHVEDGVLTIEGERRHEKKDDNERYHRVERSYGRFVRRFQLPEGATGDDVRAAYDNGVLTVTVPKPPVQPAPARRRIDVA